MLFNDNPEVRLSFFNSIFGKDLFEKAESDSFVFSVFRFSSTLTLPEVSVVLLSLGRFTGIGVMPFALKYEAGIM